MDKLHLDQHISQQFNLELEDIRNKVLSMGGLVEKQVSKGLQALLEADHDLAHEVAHSDFEINALEVCLLYTSPSPRDRQKSRMPSSA